MTLKIERMWANRMKWSHQHINIKSHIYYNRCLKQYEIGGYYGRYYVLYVLMFAKNNSYYLNPRILFTRIIAEILLLNFIWYLQPWVTYSSETDTNISYTFNNLEIYYVQVDNMFFNYSYFGVINHTVFNTWNVPQRFQLLEFLLTYYFK